jgi:hypothetical protein
VGEPAPVPKVSLGVLRTVPISQTAVGSEPETELVSDAPPESYPTANAEPKTARSLRNLALATGVFVVLALLLVPAAVLPFVAASQQSKQLLRTGTRVPGQVIRTWKTSKGWHFMDVKYQVAGCGYVHRVEIESSRPYRPGQHVTVVADPSNPLHMRTVAEPNPSTGLTLTGIGFISLEGPVLMLAVWLVPRYRSMRRRCATNRWVRAATGPQRTWRGFCGVTVTGAGPDVVVDEKLAPLLDGQAWVLADTCAGNAAILRVHKWGSMGGPVQVNSFSTWKGKRLNQSHPQV